MNNSYDAPVVTGNDTTLRQREWAARDAAHAAQELASREAAGRAAYQEQRTAQWRAEREQAQRHSENQRHGATQRAIHELSLCLPLARQRALVVAELAFAIAKLLDAERACQQAETLALDVVFQVNNGRVSPSQVAEIRRAAGLGATHSWLGVQVDTDAQRIAAVIAIAIAEGNLSADGLTIGMEVSKFDFSQGA